MRASRRENAGVAAAVLGDCLSMDQDEEGYRHRFAEQRVARLATVGRDLRPHMVPVTFAVISHVVVVAVDQKPKTTTRLRRLRNIEENSSCAFLVDEYDEDWAALWWVRADARAVVEQSGERWAAAIGQLAAKYPQYQEQRPAGPVIWADVDRWSGWAGS